MPPTFLKLKKVYFNYGDKTVLKNINFTAGHTDRIGIAGASGSGKSTLLKILAGQLTLQKGEVNYNDAPFAHLKNHLVAGHQEIKLLNQDFDLMPVLTVDENIAQKGRAMSDTQLRKHTGRCHRILELGAIKNNQAKHLSGGQKQRASLAATLAAKPKLLLLDEPFNQQDYALKNKMLAFLDSDFAQLPRLMVTHEPTDLLMHSNRVLILEKGRLVQDASPHTVYHFPVSRYAAQVTGPVNILSATQQTLLKTTETLARPGHLCPSQKGVPAKIVSSTFNGYTTFYKLSLTGDEASESLIMQSQEPELKVGKTVSVAIKKPSTREGS